MRLRGGRESQAVTLSAQEGWHGWVVTAASYCITFSYWLSA